MVIEKPIIVIDTREKQPWCWDHDDEFGGVLYEKLDGGDYSIKGLEHLRLGDLVHGGAVIPLRRCGRGGGGARCPALLESREGAHEVPAAIEIVEASHPRVAEESDGRRGRGGGQKAVGDEAEHRSRHRHVRRQRGNVILRAKHGEGLCVRRQAAGGQLNDGDAEAPEIGFVAVRAAQGTLGAHIRTRPAEGRSLVVVTQLLAGDAKVRHLHFSGSRAVE